MRLMQDIDWVVIFTPPPIKHVFSYRRLRVFRGDKTRLGTCTTSDIRLFTANSGLRLAIAARKWVR